MEDIRNDLIKRRPRLAELLVFRNAADCFDGKLSPAVPLRPPYSKICMAFYILNI